MLDLKYFTKIFIFFCIIIYNIVKQYENDILRSSCNMNGNNISKDNIFFVCFNAVEGSLKITIVTLADKKYIRMKQRPGVL